MIITSTVLRPCLAGPVTPVRGLLPSPRFKLKTCKATARGAMNMSSEGQHHSPGESLMNWRMLRFQISQRAKDSDTVCIYISLAMAAGPPTLRERRSGPKKNEMTYETTEPRACLASRSYHARRCKLKIHERMPCYVHGPSWQQTLPMTVRALHQHSQ